MSSKAGKWTNECPHYGSYIQPRINIYFSFSAIVIQHNGKSWETEIKGMSKWKQAQREILNVGFCNLFFAAPRISYIIAKN